MTNKKEYSATELAEMLGTYNAYARIRNKLIEQNSRFIQRHALVSEGLRPLPIFESLQLAKPSHDSTDLCVRGIYYTEFSVRTYQKTHPMDEGYRMIPERTPQSKQVSVPQLIFEFGDGLALEAFTQKQFKHCIGSRLIQKMSSIKREIEFKTSALNEVQKIYDNYTQHLDLNIMQNINTAIINVGEVKKNDQTWYKPN